MEKLMSVNKEVFVYLYWTIKKTRQCFVCFSSRLNKPCFHIWLFINKAYEQGVSGYKNISWGVNKLIRGRRYGVQGTLESQYTFLLVNATSGPVFDRNLAGDQNRQSIPRTKKAVRGDLNIRPIRTQTCNGIRIRGSGKFYLWKFKSWPLESGTQLKESGIPLTIIESRIQVSLTKTGIQCLEYGIHCMKSWKKKDFWIPFHHGAKIPEIYKGIA